MGRTECEYCKREPTRLYNGKGLCEFHYLKENPERNRALVNWDSLKRKRYSYREIDDILFIMEQEKIYLQEKR